MQLLAFNDISEAKRRLNVCTTVLLSKAVANAASRVPLIVAYGVPNDEIPEELVIPSSIDVDVCYDHGGDSMFSIVKLAGADNRCMRDISDEWDSKTASLRNGESLSRGSYGHICISNLGSYGIKSFETICIEPQTTLLAFGTKQLWPVDSDDNHSVDYVKNAASFTAQYFVEVTMTADHRCVNGKDAAAFLSCLAEELHLLATGDSSAAS